MRPLPRAHRGRVLPTTPPDEETEWEEAPGVRLRAALWTHVVPTLARPGPDAPMLTGVAVFDPRYRHPWLRASPLPVSPRALYALSRDRWPVEQLPALALLAGAILAYGAAPAPASLTDFWDHCPRPTAGRLRRLLAHQPFSARLPVAGASPRKTLAHRPSAHRLLGPTPSTRRLPRPRRLTAYQARLAKTRVREHS